MIIYIKKNEDLYFMYKYNPSVLNIADTMQVNLLESQMPSIEDNINTHYLVRKYNSTGQLISKKGSCNTIFIVDDKLARPLLGYSSFSYILSDKAYLFDLVSYNVFVELCKGWANPKKWKWELRYLELLDRVVTKEDLVSLYDTLHNSSNTSSYLSTVGQSTDNYLALLSLDYNSLWYPLITKNAMSQVKGMTPAMLAYFSLLREEVLSGHLSIKFALIYLEIYAQLGISLLYE